MTDTLPNGFSHDAAEHYRRLGVWNGDTHWKLFRRTVEARPHAPAAVDAVRSLTWAELDDTVARAAAVLTRAGIRRGDRAIVQLPNSVAYLETVFALWRIGAVPVFSLPAHGATDIRHFAAHAPATHYIGTAHPNKHLGRVQADLARPLPDGRTLTTVLVDDRAVEPWPADGPSPETPGAPEELAFLQLSGGTTGVPKLIPRTHDDYLYSVRASVDVCDLRADDVLLVALPASHNFTMSSPGILGAVQVGATVVFAPGPLPTEILPLIEEHRVTHLALVPPALISLLNYPDRAAHDLGSVRTVWVGGAKLSEAAARRVRPELGWNLQQVFGMAEGLVNYTPLDADVAEVVATQGRPMSPYDEVLVVDEDDNEVPPGTPGALLTRGPYTIRQYHRAPEVNARSFTAEGFYRTGDIVTFVDGVLTVVGRAKDQINRGGEKVAPEAVENVLLTHPGVHDVSVVGMPDELLGEKVRALVIPRDGAPGPLKPTALKRYARGQGLASFAVPDVIDIVDEFPVTGVGKVSKKDQSLQRPASSPEA
ncbi:(2,3-dihydroxybenzoyl)adenylate synthase [Corynebacterium kalidii]|uniref:AMP-binding protein n=1 Tax=Corynebacterium kalidii TaxID=2931982 RepID=A0A9X1WGP0_9CORY|nr:AMP-binding protein [Corynebacterium kalidii]MCJ7857828.1 AMP-binding protein [Corynebacterium kalidii]